MGSVSGFLPVQPDRIIANYVPPTPQVYWAAIVYLLLPLGILLFALPRVDPEHLAISSLAWGALFKLVVYGVHDMTNMATLENWPVRMVLVDICWGCFLCGVATWFASLASRWLQ